MGTKVWMSAKKVMFTSGRTVHDDMRRCKLIRRARWDLNPDQEIKSLLLYQVELRAPLKVVSRLGFEPRTFRLRICCSTGLS